MNTAQAAGNSDPGLVRPTNEDAFLCDLERGLFIVADGMGGHAAGAEASALVIRACDAFLTSECLAAARRCSYIERILRQAFAEANGTILRCAERHPAQVGMGSTAIIGVLEEMTLHVANLGDSRAYLIREGRATLLSRDHSIAGLLYAQGEISYEQVRTHPHRHQLTAALGSDAALVPAYIQITLSPDDRIILCSDGLWEAVRDEEITRAIIENADPARASAALIAAANAAGGQDNITVIVLCGGQYRA